MFRNLSRRLVDKLVQPDPHPEYSRLDRMDGLAELDTAAHYARVTEVQKRSAWS